MPCWLAVLAIVFFPVSGLSHGKTTAIEEGAADADQVAVVDVEGLQSERVLTRWGDEIIVTHARLKVRERLKGRFFEEQPEMTVEGGTVDGVTLKVSDQVELRRGDRLVVFLKEGNKLSNSALERRHRPFRRGHGVMKVRGTDAIEGENVTLSEVRRRVRGDR